jgi:hypothetical protein
MNESINQSNLSSWRQNPVSTRWAGGYSRLTNSAVPGLTILTLPLRSCMFRCYTSLDSEHFSDGHPCEWQPNATIAPVGVLCAYPDHYTLLLPMHPYITDPPPTIPDDFLEYLRHLPLPDQHLFKFIELLVPVTTLIEALDASASGTASTNCQGISKGTEVLSSMAIAWVFSDSTGRRLANALGLHPGLRRHRTVPKAMALCPLRASNSSATLSLGEE